MAMKVLKTSRKKSTLTVFKRTNVFRFGKTIIGKRNTNLVFNNSFYSNPEVKFEILSIPVQNGTYKIKVQSLDNKGNINTGVEGTVIIDFYPLPPVDLTISGDVLNNVTLDWNHSVNGAPDYYVIYSNSGYGNIDRTTPLDTISGSLLTYTANLPDGNWKFVVESKKNSVESVNFKTVSIVLPLSAYIPPSPGLGRVTGLVLSNVSVGKVKIDFYWLYGSSASKFNIYSDNATGTIDYDTPYATFNRQNKLIQTYTTDRLHLTDEEKTYKFVVRACTSSDVEEENTDEYSIVVDGKAPDEIQDLTLGSIF